MNKNCISNYYDLINNDIKPKELTQMLKGKIVQETCLSYDDLRVNKPK